MTGDDGFGAQPQAGRARSLNDPAARALAEAAERRRAREAAGAPPPPPEVHGRPGPEPVRYGDWENKGIAYDF